MKKAMKNLTVFFVVFGSSELDFARRLILKD